MPNQGRTFSGGWTQLLGQPRALPTPAPEPEPAGGRITSIFCTRSSDCLWRRGKEMAAVELVSFEEVAVYFAEGEWALLDSGQRSLNRDVMWENYETVALLEFDSHRIVGLEGTSSSHLVQSPAHS
ncbi:zinc finger protein 74-like [Terrapene carolina triunguis]|uniref:zinc finger protein 74-like n=1 Tax=Terrapene triunguis TaxID=2587831 RepID=UPI000E77B9A1|nr:zinc finger protein 74-like [Terrapene carolina triunguis]